MTPEDQQTAPAGAGRRGRRSHGPSAPRAGALALALALALAGCGGGGGDDVAGRSPDEIVKASARAFQEAASVRVSGEMSGGRLDFSYAAGRGSTGTMSVSGVEVEVLNADGETYLRLAGDVDRYPGDNWLARLDGRWLLVPDDEEFRSLVEFTAMETLIQFAERPRGPARTGGVERMLGQDVIWIGDANARMYVAAEGEPLPVKMVASEQGGLDLAFTDWNEPVDLPAAPAPDEVVEFHELG